MWTYKKPYTAEELTKSYIEDRGRVALSRALNIGRVIGFVASGATAGYGFKSWSQLVKDVVETALTLSELPDVRLSGAAKACREVLVGLKEASQLQAEPTHSLGLAENLTHLVGKEDEFRQRVAKMFALARDKDNQNISGPEKPIENLAQPLRRLISDLSVNRLLTLNYDAQIEEEFRRLYRTSGTSRKSVKPRHSSFFDAKSDTRSVEVTDESTDGKSKTADPVGKQGKATRNTNQSISPLYDLEPESAFDVLCGGNFERARDLPRRLEYSDGTARSVLSVSMCANNIGDLVNFALQPRQYMGQVVHLHGRYDKPEDIVLTDGDYRRTYLKSDEQAQTFEEALSALLTGNDILFVGVGMSEADMLRPLRQFMSQDKTPEFAKRHIFTMLEEKVTLDENWLRNEQKEADLEKLQLDFAANHLEKANASGKSPNGSTRQDFAKDEKEAVRLRTEFGVYALFHGNQTLRTIRMALKLLEAGAFQANYRNPLRGKICVKAYRAALQATRIELLREIKTADLTFPSYDNLTLLTKAELQKILNAVVSGLKQSDQSWKTNGLALPKAKRAMTSAKNLPLVELEVRSRALDMALLKHEHHRIKWWRDWRRTLQHRNSEFSRRYLKTDMAEERPNVARHRPIYQEVEGIKDFAAITELRELAKKENASALDAVDGLEPADTLQGGHLKTFHTNTLEYFPKGGVKDVKAGTQRDFQKVPPKRILRACMPRGFGKGALLHILQQKVPDDSRLFLDTLFPQNEKEEIPFRYHGAFCLHLSFSMEFASVISALRTFVDQALVGVFVEHAEDVLSSADRLEPGDEDTFLNFLYRQFFKDGKNNIAAEQSKLYENLAMHAKNLSAANEERQKPAIKKAFEEQIAKILNTGFWQNKLYEHGKGRMHRLEELRARLSAFTDVVDLLKDKNIRLCFVMSGLDKLCDSEGVAHNPMFRALFRILSGCGAKYRLESDITTPIDLVLLGGIKSQPIRYLSHEYREKTLRAELAKPPEGSSNDHYASYNLFRPISGNLYLKEWPVLSPIAIKERFWLENDLEIKPFQQAVSNSLHAQSTAGIAAGERPHFQDIAVLCHDSVALNSWCAGAFKAWKKGTGLYRDPPLNEEEASDTITGLMERLESAAARGELAMLLHEVMELHKSELRAWGRALWECRPMPHENNQERADKAMIFMARSWPDKALVGERQRFSGIYSEEANWLVELTNLILAHLTLFPMPVEPRILYGCDEIHDLLGRICDPDKEDVRNIVPLEPCDTVEYESAARNAYRRERRLRLLCQVLAYLHEHHLVIAVQGKHKKNSSGTPTRLDIGGEKIGHEDHHTRFTIHHQLRDFVARMMDLSVPDQGERNFFQVSIYCDQPRDLPAPREDHYKLVREIMNRQIGRSRESIWCMMQLARKNGEGKNGFRALDTLSEEMQNLAKHGLKRRLTDPCNAIPSEFDCELPSLHAVPQRIRALYGLLRSGFSIGTVSRLESSQDREIDQPYERFRGWLRGVTNAAIGWDFILKELLEVKDRKFDDEKAMKTIQHAANLIDLHGEPPEDPTALRALARPLYRDEIGWLLNERGLISLVQGQIFDAIPLFKRALTEMHHDDLGGFYDPSLHAAVRRVRLNLALALIDRGHLHRARTMLQDLQLPQDFSSHSGSQVSWLAAGYLGLIDHLSGNYPLAEAAYVTIINKAQDRDLQRLSAIFCKHYADLLRRLGRYDKAREKIGMSISAALHCSQKDVLHLAKISATRIELVDPLGSKNVIGASINTAIHFAQTMGVPRIEVEALCLQADVMLRQGDRLLAGSFASRSAAIANRNGLRLNKLLALHYYGKALHERGQLELAQHVLKETQREAERRGYQSLEDVAASSSIPSK